ncbi:MAG: response regulator [Marinibacterium sp.]
MSLANKLAEERRARLAAERLLELKQAELSAANRKLGRHALALTQKIGKTETEVASVREENERVKSDLTQANAKIELAERRLWHSIQSIRDGFAFFDADNQLIGANSAYLSVFDDLDEVAPGISYMRILQILTEEGIVNTGDLGPADWRAMMAERWYDPSPEPVIIRFWNDRYVRVLDQRGHGGDVVSLTLDITETVRYEEKLKAERERAEAANRAKSAFLANMSHEIRTPMNGVVGMADLLDDTELTEEQRLYVSTIKNSGEALLVIINDVLDYSKIEAEKLQLHPEPFDLERCIHEVVMLLQPAARDKGLALLIDYDVFLPTRLVGDPGRIRQVMTNLIGNAVKFTLEGHVLIRVTGVPDRTGKGASIHVSIEDTGIGIPAEKLDLIFGEFNQVEDERNRQFEGTGLGLAISRRLVSMMGGQIWVDSEEGKGSCFGFALSLDEAEGAQPQPPRLPPGLTCAFVVDNQTVNGAILEKQLRQLGVEVTCCNSAAEALDAIDDRVGLIMCEQDMPDMDGFELAEALKDRSISAPFLLLSTTPGFAESDPARPLVSAVLQKPLSRSDLFQALAGLESLAPPDGAQIPAAPAFNRATSDGTQDAPPADRSGESAGQETERQVRILAAEDNKTNQLVFRKMVQGLDIDLKFANNGIEAVAEFSDFAPDIVFMDISMPKMDGKEATAKIREIEKTTGGHVPIIAMTAHAMSGDKEGILSAGLDDYMTKPLRKAAIHDRIRDLAPDSVRPPVPDAAAPEPVHSAAAAAS